MMPGIPLRIKFLASLLLVCLALTVTSLLFVRRTVNNQIRADIAEDLQSSVVTFTGFQREREATLSRFAELLADLPNVRALMTTNDTATIQDASTDIWRLSGTDLFLLAGAAGKLMAVHATNQDLPAAVVQEALTRSAKQTADTQWWFLDGHLYEIFLRPIYVGRLTDNRVQGILAVGYEINQGMVRNVSRIAACEVTFLHGDSVVASTIAAPAWPELARKLRNASGTGSLEARDFQLGTERYLATSVDLTTGATPSVRLSVLKSYDQATAFYSGLYRSLVILGLLALLAQSAVIFVVLRRYTQPLEKLVDGVRALGKGDFTYPLDARGRDELAEVTASFVRMRDDLRQAQEQLLDSERLATIGRMASSISHDLRHQLTAIVANSEFLCERNLDYQESEEIYQEIRNAVGQMTDLIDSLLEFSRTRDALSPAYGRIAETMQQAIRSVQSHPAGQKVQIALCHQGADAGWFDPKKLGRVFYNLLLNACQAVPPEEGKVEADIREIPGGVEISVSDNGPGIPERLRDKIFEPFMSYGKENGTGLGLTIVQKILEDHGGTIKLEYPSPGRTTFKITLPLRHAPDAEGPYSTSMISKKTISTK